MQSADVVNVTALRLTRRVQNVREWTGSLTTSNSSFVTLMSISGSGWLFHIGGYVSGSSGGAFRVTIDGQSYQFDTDNFLPRFATRAGALPIVNTRFESSVTVEFAAFGGVSNTGYVSVVWGDR